MPLFFCLFFSSLLRMALVDVWNPRKAAKNVDCHEKTNSMKINSFSLDWKRMEMWMWVNIIWWCEIQLHRQICRRPHKPHISAHPKFGIFQELKYENARPPPRLRLNYSNNDMNWNASSEYEILPVNLSSRRSMNYASSSGTSFHSFPRVSDNNPWFSWFIGVYSWWNSLPCCVKTELFFDAGLYGPVPFVGAGVIDPLIHPDRPPATSFKFALAPLSSVGTTLNWFLCLQSTILRLVICRKLAFCVLQTTASVLCDACYLGVFHTTTLLETAFVSLFHAPVFM